MFLLLTTEHWSGKVEELLSLSYYSPDFAKLKKEYSQNAELYGYFFNNELVGCIGVRLQKQQCEVIALAVLPTYQGQGIGSLLLKRLSEQLHVSTIFLETDDSAVTFYRQNHFIVESLGEKYPGVERYYCQLKPTD